MADIQSDTLLRARKGAFNLCLCMSGLRIIPNLLGQHEVEEHDGNDFDVECTISTRDIDIYSREALETFWTSSPHARE